MIIFDSVRDVFDKYDTFLIDVYGVLYNGARLFDGVLELLKSMKKAGKQIIILSNTTLVEKECHERYAKMGMLQGLHYDIFLSSGEVLKNTILQHVPHSRSYHQILTPNKSLFKNFDLHESENIENADFIYVGNPNNPFRIYIANNLKKLCGTPIKLEDITKTDYHEISGFSEIADILDKCLKFNKTLVVANPDLFAIEKADNQYVPILCQGTIGELYERQGGKVVYCGKPYSTIYSYAKQFIEPNAKIAMVGDTPWTDILGGNMAGVQTILCLSGILKEFMKFAQKDLPLISQYNFVVEKFSKNMTHSSLLQGSQVPTFIVKSFA